jgi:hypothetical protein
MKQFVLRIIAGADQGADFPLTEGVELLLGRHSTAAVVIGDERASRQHAAIVVSNNQVGIHDLSSRNGTYVNGQRITRATLQVGDRVQIGECVMMLTAVELPPAETEPGAAGNDANGERFRGSLREIPLVDLLQMLTTARKSGMLVLRNEGETGRVFLEGGRIYYACTADWLDVDPHKALYRLLSWAAGTFELEKSDVRPFANPITEPTDALLLEGMRQLDELRNLGRDLPPMDAEVSLAKPLPARLADLEDRDLDFLQLVLTHGTVRGVLDHFAGSDFEGYTYLRGMVGRRFVTVTVPPAAAQANPTVAREMPR